MPIVNNPFADMEPTEEAPYGWTVGDDGQPRPKRRRGRRPKTEQPAEVVDMAEQGDSDTPGESPSLDDLGLEADPEPERPRIKPLRLRKTKVKVTPAQRKDIQAKIALLLMAPAGMVARRDPYCGTVLVEQLPPISAALADIACDSAEVVAYFTTTGSGFMKWMNLVLALQPVGEMYWAHHVTGAVGRAERSENEEAFDYHAPAFG
jgi:hypothetical protein